jgi:hypothetical protein
MAKEKARNGSGTRRCHSKALSGVAIHIWQIHGVFGLGNGVMTCVKNIWDFEKKEFVRVKIISRVGSGPYNTVEKYTAIPYPPTPDPNTQKRK